MKITQSVVRDIFDYRASDGVLVRRSGKYKGVECTLVNGSGYVTVSVFGKTYRAHRLIWLHQNGCWPEKGLDHRNGIKNDNRIENLRPCDQSENQYNIHNKRPNLTGYTGVFIRRGRFRSCIYVKNKKISLGTYDTAEDAGRAYERAKRKLHSFADDSVFVFGETP